MHMQAPASLRNNKFYHQGRNHVEKSEPLEPVGKYSRRKRAKKSKEDLIDKATGGTEKIHDLLDKLGSLKDGNLPEGITDTQVKTQLGLMNVLEGDQDAAENIANFTFDTKDESLEAAGLRAIEPLVMQTSESFTGDQSEFIKACLSFAKAKSDGDKREAAGHILTFTKSSGMDGEFFDILKADDAAELKLLYALLVKKGFPALAIDIHGVENTHIDFSKRLKAFGKKDSRTREYRLQQARIDVERDLTFFDKHTGGIPTYNIPSRIQYSEEQLKRVYGEEIAKSIPLSERSFSFYDWAVSSYAANSPEERSAVNEKLMEYFKVYDSEVQRLDEAIAKAGTDQQKADLKKEKDKVQDEINNFGQLIKDLKGDGPESNRSEGAQRLYYEIVDALKQAGTTLYSFDKIGKNEERDVTEKAVNEIVDAFKQLVADNEIPSEVIDAQSGKVKLWINQDGHLETDPAKIIAAGATQQQGTPQAPAPQTTNTPLQVPQSATDFIDTDPSKAGRMNFHKKAISNNSNNVAQTETAIDDAVATLSNVVTELKTQGADTKGIEPHLQNLKDSKSKNQKKQKQLAATTALTDASKEVTKLILAVTQNTTTAQVPSSTNTPQVSTNNWPKQVEFTIKPFNSDIKGYSNALQADPKMVVIDPNKTNNAEISLERLMHLSRDVYVDNRSSFASTTKGYLTFGSETITASKVEELDKKLTAARENVHNQLAQASGHTYANTVEEMIGILAEQIHNGMFNGDDKQIESFISNLFDRGIADSSGNKITDKDDIKTQKEDAVKAIRQVINSYNSAKTKPAAQAIATGLNAALEPVKNYIESSSQTGFLQLNLTDTSNAITDFIGATQRRASSNKIENTLKLGHFASSLKAGRTDDPRYRSAAEKVKKFFEEEEDQAKRLDPSKKHGPVYIKLTATRTRGNKTKQPDIDTRLIGLAETIVSVVDANAENKAERLDIVNYIYQQSDKDAPTLNITQVDNLLSQLRSNDFRNGLTKLGELEQVKYQYNRGYAHVVGKAREAKASFISDFLRQFLHQEEAGEVYTCLDKTEEALAKMEKEDLSHPQVVARLQEIDSSFGKYYQSRFTKDRDKVNMGDLDHVSFFGQMKDFLGELLSWLVPPKASAN